MSLDRALLGLVLLLVLGSVLARAQEAVFLHPRGRSPQGARAWLPGGSVHALGFGRGGALLAVAGELEEGIRLFQTDYGRQLWSHRDQPSPVRALEFTPDGRGLVAGLDAGLVHLDVDDGRRRSGAAGTWRRLRAMALAPDAAWVATAGDASVELRSLDALDTPRRLTPAPGLTHALAVAPDSRLLATGGVDRQVHLFEVSDRRRVLESDDQGGWVLALAFTPDGRQLVVAGDFPGVRLLDVVTGERLGMLPGVRSWVEALAISGDGRWLAAGGAAGEVLVWDLVRRRQAQRLDGHFGAVRALRFSPDASWLASGGSDGALVLWDMTALGLVSLEEP